MDQKKFYVYVDYTDDGRPFYVGKGSGGRAKIFNRNPLHENISNKYGIHRIIVYETYDENDAFATEIRLIGELETYEPFGKGGANLTLGGEGITGAIITDEQRKRNSENIKKLWQIPEYREKISASLSIVTEKNWKDPMFREMMMNLRRDPEIRGKISDTVKDLWRDENYRNKVNEARSTVQNHPDFAKRISEGILASSTHEQRSERIKKMWNERGDELRKISSEKFKDPVFKAKMEEAQKKRWQRYRELKALGLIEKKTRKPRSKESREKVSDSLKKVWELKKIKEKEES